MLFDGLRPVLIGLVIGLLAGGTAASFIQSILYGTDPLDPIVLSIMVASLLLTAVIACVLPAIRASKIEPMEALQVQ